MQKSYGFTENAQLAPKEIPEQEFGSGLDPLLRLFDAQTPLVIIKRASGMDLVLVNTELLTGWNITTEWEVTSENGVEVQGQTIKGK